MSQSHETKAADKKPGAAFFDHFDRHAHGKGLKGGTTHYCPGCGHGLAHKFLAEALVELGVEDRTVMISPVGCAVFLFYYFDTGNTQAAHGRAPAVALGHKLANPNSIVVSYQGDGDLAAIGLAEIMHAAQLGIPISVIFINNAIYGMTGGQMAPTTLPGQWSATTPEGRGPMQGQPMHVSEVIAKLDGASYVERCALYDQRERKRCKAAIKKALQLQVEGRGFGFVEILAECPTHWHMTSLESELHVKNVMAKEYPLGLIKDVTREPWFSPAKPTFDVERVLDVLETERDTVERFCQKFPEHLDPLDVSIKLAGSGGDGAQTAAMLVTRTAICEGYDSTHIPSYGPESRGGTSYADVHIAKSEVLSPAAPHPHVLVAFNAPSLDKFAGDVRPGGMVIYDASVIAKAPKVAEGVRVHAVPMSAIAQRLGNVVVKSVVALGALQQAAQVLDERSFLGELRRSLSHKAGMIPVNEEAFKAGVQAVRTPA
ncbi:MAG: 2-oxoacid:acceptor oxidoreductase family protein [Deltaproteobacteria bacterium]|nr:2-oxoacid:acceptor oxidoreductase family protein [Deltaproteobacteria bacterium]